MKATQTETGWLIRSENNQEEIALTHFLKVHEHISFSTTSTECSEEADAFESIVSLLCPDQPEGDPLDNP